MKAPFVTLSFSFLLQVVKLLQALARLRAAGRFQLFEMVPDPEQSWPSSDGHGYLVYNKIVPLPLALETIQVSRQGMQKSPWD